MKKLCISLLLIIALTLNGCGLLFDVVRVLLSDNSNSTSASVEAPAVVKKDDPSANTDVAINGKSNNTTRPKQSETKKETNELTLVNSEFRVYSEELPDGELESHLHDLQFFIDNSEARPMLDSFMENPNNKIYFTNEDGYGRLVEDGDGIVIHASIDRSIEYPMMLFVYDQLKEYFEDQGWEDSWRKEAGQMKLTHDIALSGPREAFAAMVYDVDFAECGDWEAHLQDASPEFQDIFYDVWHNYEFLRQAYMPVGSVTRVSKLQFSTDKTICGNVRECLNTLFKYDLNINNKSYPVYSTCKLPDKNVKALEISLARVPDQILQSFYNERNGVVLVADKQNWEYIEDCEFKIAADYCGAVNVDVHSETIVVKADDNEPFGRTILHEFGHVVDDMANGLSYSDKWVHLWADEKDNKKLRDYYKESRDEYFAESCANYFLDTRRFKRANEDDYSYIQDVIENYNNYRDIKGFEAYVADYILMYPNKLLWQPPE